MKTFPWGWLTLVLLPIDLLIFGLYLARKWLKRKSIHLLCRLRHIPHGQESAMLKDFGLEETHG
jgi:hypothetical protein